MSSQTTGLTAIAEAIKRGDDAEVRRSLRQGSKPTVEVILLLFDYGMHEAIFDIPELSLTRDEVTTVFEYYLADVDLLNFEHDFNAGFESLLQHCGVPLSAALLFRVKVDKNPRGQELLRKHCPSIALSSLWAAISYLWRFRRGYYGRMTREHAATRGGRHRESWFSHLRSRPPPWRSRTTQLRYQEPKASIEYQR